MGTLILDRKELDLRWDGAALTLYESGERKGSIPINLLQRVILQGKIRLDSDVLAQLGEAGITTLMLSRRHSRRSGLVLGPGHNEAALRLAQYQLALDPVWREGWSRRLLIGKSRAQQRLIMQARMERSDCRKPLTDALHSLERIHQRLIDDASAQKNHPASAENVTASLDTLRGLEGAAARAYFQGLTALFPPSLDFTGRNRRPPRDPVNACLSLAYTLLHFDAVRACHISGLDPLLGFFHRPAIGRESLASDLIEPLRPRIDAWVWHLFRSRILRDEHFARDGEACLLKKSGREYFYRAYEPFAAHHRRHLRRECQVLARALRQKGAPLLESFGQDND